MNPVKDVVYQSDGPKAVAYFRKPIGNSLTLNSCNESSYVPDSCTPCLYRLSCNVRRNETVQTAVNPAPPDEA